MNEKKNPKPAPSSGRHSFLRMLVGIYLLYLAYCLMQDYAAGRTDGMPPAVYLGTAAVFGVLGLGFLLWQLPAMLGLGRGRTSAEEKTQPPAESDE